MDTTDCDWKRPSFLGLGVARAGTRWLAQCLAEHPEIIVSAEEASFFVRRRLLSTWQNGFAWYGSLFHDPLKPNAKVWGEISPPYLGDAESAGLIRAYAPDAKLICILRNQSEALHSAYRLFLHFNPDLSRTSLSYYTYLLYSPKLFDEYFYLEHIQRFHELFPKEQLLVLVYDDIKNNPDHVLRCVFQFLGVDESFSAKSSRTNINPMELVVKRSEFLARITRFMSSRRGLSRLSNVMDGFNSTHVKRADLPERHRSSEELNERIRNIYHAHNERLGDFLGRDLSHWNLWKE